MADPNENPRIEIRCSWPSGDVHPISSSQQGIRSRSSGSPASWADTVPLESLSDFLADVIVTDGASPITSNPWAEGWEPGGVEAEASGPHHRYEARRVVTWDLGLGGNRISNTGEVRSSPIKMGHPSRGARGVPSCARHEGFTVRSALPLNLAGARRWRLSAWRRFNPSGAAASHTPGSPMRPQRRSAW